MTTDERFFREHLLPLAKGEMFPMHPDPSLSTYWIDRDKRTLSKADFEEPSVRTPEELGAKLAAMWRAKGDVALAETVPAMQKLAAELKREHQTQDDVSPFIYVMY